MLMGRGLDPRHSTLQGRTSPARKANIHPMIRSPGKTIALCIRAAFGQLYTGLYECEDMNERKANWQNTEYVLLTRQIKHHLVSDHLKVLWVGFVSRWGGSPPPPQGCCRFP